MPPQDQEKNNGEVGEEKTPLKQIRTYQGDVARALGNQKESLFSIQQKEHLKQGRVIPPDDTDDKLYSRRKQFALLLLGTLVLVTLSVIGGWFAYQEFIKKTAPPVVEAPANRFITPNTEIDFNIASSSRAVILQGLIQTKNNVNDRELRHIILKEGQGENASIATTQEFLNSLNVKASGSLLRSFNPLFMFGSLGDNAFIIIKLDSFENAFAGMLSWEENLAEDLGSLFIKPKSVGESFGTVGTTTQATTTPSKIFEDKTIRNKDIRILNLPDENMLLYSFFNNGALIIAGDTDTLMFVIDRLNREQLSR